MNKQYTVDIHSINRDKSLLNKQLLSRIEDGLKELKSKDLNLQIFEGWRAPSRQNYLYEQGRTREGRKVTNAQAWDSWHQFGLAADVVFYGKTGWTWDGDWNEVQRVMKIRGLTSVRGDLAHFQLKPKPMSIKMAYDVVSSDGILGLWQIVGEEFD